MTDKDNPTLVAVNVTYQSKDFKKSDIIRRHAKLKSLNRRLVGLAATKKE